MTIARVVVNLSLDREFDYRIPDRLAGSVRIGSRVRVPFGKGNRPRRGFVVGLKDSSGFANVKEISAVEGDKALIPPKLMELAQWMAEYYCCPREQAVRSMLPAVVRGGKMKRKALKFAAIAPGVDVAEHISKLKNRAKKQVAVLQALVRHGSCSIVQLERETGAGRGVVKRLAEKELVRIEDRTVQRDPFSNDVILPTKPLTLTDEQHKACRLITRTMERPDPEVILLHGVTGSGKTEVYLQAISHCLERGLETIVLVPEISLTPQTTERFRSRFGEKVSVLHSGLSDGERFDEWTRIHDGRSSIVVGARSALFAPFRNLGLIVVDEEHENSYKQEEAPRYNARDMAVMRGKLENATVVLGSATPSLESRYNCETGKYQLAKLTSRIDERRLPVMELIDMRSEAALKNKGRILSSRLVDLIRGRLEAGEQIILFLNRRGYARQFMCTECGFVATCDDCSITYTYHKNDGILCCHLCGRLMHAPKTCPECGKGEILFSGMGTEKVESITKMLFPKAAVKRMDSDTMTTKNSYKNTLDAFRAGRINILIGTQMIAKGLDFPNVTLVGVIFADAGLHLPDFRASERTFQLLTQVAGRAGRGEIPGHVIVQSYTPRHPALMHALSHDYDAFYTEEIPSRKMLGFPPAAHLVAVHFRSPEEKLAAAAAEDFADEFRDKFNCKVRLGGPMPAPITKIRAVFRYQLMIRTARIRRLVALLRELVVERKPPKDVTIHVDVDARSLL